VSGEVIGTLTFNTGVGQTFTEESLRLGERVPAQISGSFLSAALSESLEKEAARRNSLNRIDEIIGSNLDFSEVFDDFAVAFADAVGCDLVVITDVDFKADTLDQLSGLWSSRAGYGRCSLSRVDKLAGREYEESDHGRS